MSFRFLAAFRRGAFPLVAGLAMAVPAATTHVFGPNETEDASIYSDAPDGNNGAGADLFAGQTGGRAGFALRRTLIRFDVSSIPASETVIGVTLEMRINQVPQAPVAGPHSLHRLTADWGEGDGVGSGFGAGPSDGGVSWNSRMHPDVLWDTFGGGGDSVSTASAATDVGESIGTVTWSGPGLASDVQGWVDGSVENHGWILKSAESGQGFTARRYDSSETAGGSAPQLTVETGVIEPPETGGVQLR